MAHEVGELEPPVARDFKDGVVEPGGQLLDAGGLAAARGAEDVERVARVEEPDNEVAAGLMEDLAGVEGRGVAGGAGIALDDSAALFTAEYLPGVQLDRLQGGEFFMDHVHRGLLQSKRPDSMKEPGLLRMLFFGISGLVGYGRIIEDGDVIRWLPRFGQIGPETGEMANYVICQQPWSY